MGNVIIGGTATGATPLPSASTIDGTLDLLPIYTASATATQAINRSTLLGVTGQPADLSSVQTFTNKVIGNTNTLTVKDTLATLQNTADTTKQAKFQLSGITTGTTRTYTLPDITDTLTTLTATQTLTNKTLTSPTINAPTITNASITTDTITGFTTAGTGTVYGISIASGAISTSGYASSTALQTNAVQANQLATNAITSGYAQITTSFTTSSASAVQITGLTATVTIPAGGRRVKITVWADCTYNSSAAFNTISLWDGTVGSGTMLAESELQITGSNVQVGVTTLAVVSPAAGSKTYNVGILTTTGTATYRATSGTPAFILVENI